MAGKCLPRPNSLQCAPSGAGTSLRTVSSAPKTANPCGTAGGAPQSEEWACSYRVCAALAPEPRLSGAPVVPGAPVLREFLQIAHGHAAGPPGAGQFAGPAGAGQPVTQVAVAVGLRTAASGSVAGLEETSVRALAKLQQVLPARLRRRVSAFQSHALPVPPGGPQVDPEC